MRLTAPEDILRFWFGDPAGEEDFSEDRFHLWFNGTPEIDEEIRSRFGEDVGLALQGGYDVWKGGPQGSLALILLLDQFTRNIYRDTPEAFAGDAKALEAARAALDQDFDRRLLPVQRAFLYMPFEHSEELAVQELSVACFERLLKESPPALELPLGNMKEYAVRHYEIIRRFGRFPHRNETLGRKSTGEEIEFLKQPGSSF